MVKRELDYGYELEADTGKELVLIAGGAEIARTKQVFIPTGETMNKWSEVDERVKEPEPATMLATEEKIEALEFEIERLKQELISK